MTNKPFVLADIKDLINQLDLEEISMSRLVEILNEKADAAREDEAVGFGKWISDNCDKDIFVSDIMDIYQLYLKSKQKQHIVDIMNDDAKDGLYNDKNENNNQ